MPASHRFRTPIPIFVPALSVALVLTVLFLVGLKEQNKLIDDRVEQVIGQHEIIARIVAENMDKALRDTEDSIQRYARALGQALDTDLTEVNPDQRFAAWFEALPDGSIRSRRDIFDGREEAGVWIPDYATPSPELKRFYLHAKPLTDLYGQAARNQTFVNTWTLSTAGGLAIFWPDEPLFVFDAANTVDYRNSEWVQLANPANNPQREVRWTRLSFDPVPQIWMTSAVAPVYRGQEWVASAGHDLPLDNLLARAELLRESKGSYFALVTADGRIVASDRYADRIKQSQGTLTLAQLQDDVLARALGASSSATDNATFVRHPVRGHTVFVAHIETQALTLLNAIPLAPIAGGIQQSFANLRNIALIALVAELIIATLILAWSHHRARRQFNHLAAMQEQLVRSEQHYRTLVDNIPGIVYRCKNDADWSMLFLSPIVERFTGYPAEDFIGNKARSFASVIHPDDRRGAELLVQNALERGKPYVLEYRIVHKSGTVLWMLEHGRVVTSGTGQAEELEGVMLDITALKQAEARLRELNDSLEQQVEQRTAELRNAIRDLEAFNYAVSHDLKAPVRQVTGFLDAIADELPGGASDDIRDMIRRSQNALKRMKEMIASLHAYSQLTRDSLTLGTVNVNDLLTYIVDLVPKPVRQRIQLDSPPIDNVVADRTLLRVVLHHLLDNAIKFSAQAEKPVIRLIDHSTSAEWMLEVRDNGVGFNPEYRDNMFQLFQRLHTQETFPGFGVGLALARKIMTLHGGRIWAESEPGKGASFFISIPVKVTRARAATLSAAP